MAVCSRKVGSFLKRAAVVAVGVAAVFAAGEVRATTYYLKPGGDDSAAGTSAATALKSLSVALAKDDVTEIQIAAGTYDAMTPTAAPSSSFNTVGYLAVVTKPVRIVGAGVDQVTLKCNKGSLTHAAGLWIDNADAEVSGVTVDGVACTLQNSSLGLGFHVKAGLVHHCTVRNCSSTTHPPMAHLGGANAVVRDCVIRDSIGPVNRKCTPGVTMVGGLLERTTIANCQGGDGTGVCGLSISDGVAKDCTITNNYAIYSSVTAVGGVAMSGTAQLVGCTVVGNFGSMRDCAMTGTSVAGVKVGSANCVVSNCTITANVNCNHGGTNVGGLWIANVAAKVYDTTIANNIAMGGPELYMSGSCLVTNCTIRNNEGNETVRRLGGTLADCTVDDGTTGDTRPAVTYVGKDQGNEAPYDTPAKATPSLQQAINAVKVGGTVIVATGNYTENLDLQISVPGYHRNVLIAKKVTVKGPDDCSAVFTYRNNTDRCCGLQIGCTNALVSGLTLKGSFKQGVDGFYSNNGNVLQLHAGTVSNCVVTGCNCDSHAWQSAAIVGGLMTHSSIRDNYLTGFGRGAQGLWIAGGEFAHGSILRNGIKESTRDQAAANGVYMTGGRIYDSIIEGNYGGFNYGNKGSGVAMTGGTLEKCIVQCNTNTTGTAAGHAGGVYVSGGTLKNCLIAGNKAETSSSSSAGGLYLNSTSAKVQHCTIVNNVAPNGNAAAYFSEGANVVASVADVAVNDVKGNADIYDENVVFLDSSTGLPVTWANANAFSITKASAGYNAVHENYVTEDLLGVTRPVIEAGSTDFPDAGAMEKVAAAGLTASVTPESATMVVGETVTFTVILDGDDTRVQNCEWTITLNGVSTVTNVASDVFEFTPERSGAYELSVKATNKSGVTAPAKTVSATYQSNVAYVSTDGSDTYPYDTPATASRSVARAVEAVYVAEGHPGIVYIAEGDYTALETTASTRGGSFADVDCIAEVKRAVKIVGAGREKTILRCRKNTKSKLAGFYLNHAEASLTGVTIRDGGVPNVANGSPGAVAWGLDVVQGVASNCAVICGGVADNHMPALCVNGSQAAVYDTVVTNNHKQAVNYKQAVVYVKAGLLQDSLLSDNYSSESSPAHGLYLSGGTVRNCEISHHDGDGQGSTAGGVYVAGGRLEGCRIAYNHHSGRTQTGAAVGGCYLSSGTVTNCLFLGNRDEAFSASSSAGGLYVAGGTAVDCTLVENTSFTGGAQLRISGGTAANMLVEKLNGVPTYERTGGTLTGVCESAAPGFKDRVNFELPYASECRTAGWRPPSEPTDVEVAILSGKYCYRAGEDAVVTAKVTNGSATTYAWKVTTKDGTTTPAGTDVLTLTAPASGDYSVEVEAFSGDTSLGKASIPVIVRPAKCYVSTTGGAGTWPFDDSDKATSSIQTAIDTVYADDETRGEVEIATGTYPAGLIPAQSLNAGKACIHVAVTKRIHLKGDSDDAEDVWLKTSNGTKYAGGIVVANPEALASGFKLTSAGRGDASWYHSATALQLGAGTASNVVVTGCSHANHYRAMVCIEKLGTMTCSTVRDNAIAGCGRVAVGVAIRAGGKLLSSSVLRNTVASNGDMIQVGGVYMTGADSVISNCIVEGNAVNASYGGRAGGVYVASGTLANSIVQKNNNAIAGGDSHVGGVYLSDGKVLNCFIGGNYAAATASSTASGLYVAGNTAKAHHLTVVGNSSAGGRAVYVANGASLAGSIVVNNDNATQVGAGTGAPNYCCYPEATSGVGTGNTSETVNFVDSTQTLPVDWTTVANYGITKVSAGYNMVEVNYVTNDLLGVSRPVVGESEDCPDCGAMEVVSSGKLEAFLVASSETYGAGDTAVFTVTLDGDCTEIKEVTWKVTVGETTTTTVTTTNELRLANMNPCDCTVAVVVENVEGAKTEEKSVTRRVSPRVCYVGLGGTATWPYDTEGTASSNLFDAVEAVYCESSRPGQVIVLPGTYNMIQKTAGSATYIASLGKAVHVIGRDGPEATVIRQTRDDVGNGILVSHAGALIAGITLTGSYMSDGSSAWTTSAGGFNISDGVVSNCVITSLTGGEHGLPAVIVSGGGALVDSRVTHNGHDGGHGRGSVVYQKGGTVSGCEISGNWFHSTGGSGHANGDMIQAGGAYVTGGILSNCVIRANRSSYGNISGWRTAGGVKISGGEMWNCWVVCNTNDSYSDTTAVSGLSVVGPVKVRNCLVAGNVYFDQVATDSPAVSVDDANAEIANLTVTDNTNTYASATRVGVTLGAGKAYNMIAWRNLGANPSAANWTAAEGTTVERCLIDVDPLFRKPANGDYRLRTGSPAAKIGVYQGWMDGATDLAGNPRIRRAGDGKVKVDAGCYQSSGVGFVLIVR